MRDLRTTPLKDRRDFRSGIKRDNNDNPAEKSSVIVSQSKNFLTLFTVPDFKTSDSVTNLRNWKGKSMNIDIPRIKMPSGHSFLKSSTRRKQIFVEKALKANLKPLEGFNVPVRLIRDILHEISEEIELDDVSWSSSTIRRLKEKHFWRYAFSYGISIDKYEDPEFDSAKKVFTRKVHFSGNCCLPTVKVAEIIKSKFFTKGNAITKRRERVPKKKTDVSHSEVGRNRKIKPKAVVPSQGFGQKNQCTRQQKKQQKVHILEREPKIQTRRSRSRRPIEKIAPKKARKSSEKEKDVPDPIDEETYRQLMEACDRFNRTVIVEWPGSTAQKEFPTTSSLPAKKDLQSNPNLLQDINLSVEDEYTCKTYEFKDKDYSWADNDPNNAEMYRNMTINMSCLFEPLLRVDDVDVEHE